MPKSVKRVNKNKRFTRKQKGGEGNPFAGTAIDTMAKQMQKNAQVPQAAPIKFAQLNTTLKFNISGAPAAKAWNANAEFAKAKNTGSFCASFNNTNSKALKSKLLEDDDWLENTAGHYKKLSGKSGCVFNSVKATN